MVPLCYYLSHVAKMGVQGLFAGIGIAVLVASAMLAIRFHLFTRRVILPV
jgi:Na+-driven multidrug efflux pump